MTTKIVSIKVGVTTPGVQSLQGLNASLQQTSAQTQAASQAAGRLRAAWSQFTSAAGQPVPNPMANVTSGASSAAAEVLSLVGKLASLAAVAGTVSAAFKKGLDVNAQTESAVLGIKSLVAALTTVKDESGNVVKDVGQAIAISGGIAEEQVKKLRIAGLQTSATFQQLLEAFQQGIGAGASAGLALDQIRELTIGITQAAGALGMPMHQLNQEVRSLLSGDISSDSTVAKALNITKKQVDQWRESGKLADELNKRLEVFKRLGPEAGATWTATLSNVQDAMELVLGEMSKGAFDDLKQSMQAAMSQVFDLDTVGIAGKFEDLADAGTAVFSAIGHVLNDAFTGGISLAETLSDWFRKHADEVAEVGNAFSVIYDNTKEVLKTILSTVGAVINWGTETGVVRGVLGTIAVVVAMIQDGFTLWKGVLADVGGYIIDKVGGPLRTVIGSLRDFLSKIPGVGEGLAKAVDGVLRSIPATGDGLHAIAKGIQADFDAGRTAVARTNAELSKTGKELREQAAERERESRRGQKEAPKGTATGKKAPSDDAGKAAKRAAEAYAAALRAYADAETAAAKKVSQAQREIAEAELDKSLQARLVSYDDYLKKKADLQKQALAEEVEAAKKQAVLLESDISKESDPAKRKKLEADLLKVKAEIQALQKKGVVIDTKLQIDRENFRRQVEELRVDIKANITDIEGRPFDAAMQRLKKETEELLNDPRVRDDAELAAAVRRQSELKAEKLQLDEIKRLTDEKVQYLSIAEERIALALEQGSTTALEAERDIRKARLDTAAAILKQVEALEALARANPGNSALALEAVKARLEYEKLAKAVDKTAQSINQAFAGGFVSAVEAALNGTERSLTGFLKRIALAAVQSWQQAAGNQLNSLVMKWLGGTGGVGGMLSQFMGGNWMSGLSSLFGGFFANGGDYPANKFIVVGENGPEVLFPGVSGSVATNSALTSAVASMAGTGRRVSASDVGSIATAAAPVFSPVIRIINEDNPQRAREAMDSAEGDTVIRNSMERNVNSLRQLLGIRQ